MEDWEDEQIPPIPTKEQSKINWDDEDVDNDDVKESWEDEDEHTTAPETKPPVERAPKKPAVEAAEKKGKTVEVVKEEPLDPVAEKLRQQRLVEEADYKSTKELFGERGDEKTLDNFIPKSDTDFLEYAELVSQKLRPFEPLGKSRSLLTSQTMKWLLLPMMLLMTMISCECFVPVRNWILHLSH
ncbi:eukaryotic translation initiation factor 3 subunit J-like isoform X2 [Quercus lobata]|uniref:eukaryotic translation initiation factor 3 subunit J-like isoform X2 n=1 Tax=Quercus lobata TaxID=97700 RepID=UPI001246BB17|nr:eukaryotic translation initiation factor 3 subunit J-like isoform X2 [Quercus lobata]